MAAGGGESSGKAPRVAVLGFSLEAHRWAAPCGLADFKRYGWWEGEAITAEARAAKPAIKLEIPGFYKGMDEAYGDWVPVPIMLIETAPAGPVEAAFYRAHLAEVEKRLRAALPLDGVRPRRAPFTARRRARPSVRAAPAPRLTLARSPAGVHLSARRRVRGARGRQRR